MSSTPLKTILEIISPAISARAELFDKHHESAFRLFNGFYEGCPYLVIDLYARTLLIYNYADNPEDILPIIQALKDDLLTNHPGISTVILKTRHAIEYEARRGILFYGQKPDNRVRERGVWYALELRMNQDSSLYLDTRYLRAWALENLKGTSVLNTFAYTGSLGVAARAGGAHRVVYLDRNRKFLNVAKTSYTLNGFPIHKADFKVGDFWGKINQLKRSDELFDCVFLDPPMFSKTKKGTVDLTTEPHKLINKVRPLVRHGGWLVVINNALFVSGSDFMRTLQVLCADGYLSIEDLIPVPQDITGYPQTRVRTPPTDPAPFNHPTKIVILRVQRKDKRIK